MRTPTVIGIGMTNTSFIGTTSTTSFPAATSSFPSSGKRGFLVFLIFSATLIDFTVSSLAFFGLIPTSIDKGRFGMSSTLSLCSSNPVSSPPKSLHASHFNGNSLSGDITVPALPAWFDELKSVSGVKLVKVPEWEENSWRNGEGGFHGHDFCHSVLSAVRVLDYVVLPPESTQGFPKLVGAVYFSPRAESHRGLCHGGSMCAIMDDVMGWCGFCSSVKRKERGGDFAIVPWNGYTVQVNTALRKSVRIGSILRLEASVTRKEGARKHWIAARLFDPETLEVFCEGEGLFLLNKEEVDGHETCH